MGEDGWWGNEAWWLVEGASQKLQSWLLCACVPGQFKEIPELILSRKLDELFDDAAVCHFYMEHKVEGGRNTQRNKHTYEVELISSVFHPEPHLQWRFCGSHHCSRGRSQRRDGAAPLSCSPTLRFTLSGIQPELGRTCQAVYHSPAGAISWNIPEVLSEVTDHSLICGYSPPHYPVPTPPTATPPSAPPLPPPPPFAPPLSPLPPFPLSPSHYPFLLHLPDF